MPQKTNTIAAVLFDAAGTLIELAEPIGKVYARIAQRHGFVFDSQQVETEFRRAWKAMPPLGTKLPNGDRSEKGWWRWLVEQIIDELADGASGDHGNYFEELFAYYAKPTAWVICPETLSTLNRLKARGLRLAVLSNFDSRLLPVLDGLDLSQFFEEIYYSGAIGYAKPNPKIFAHAVDGLSLKPDQCLHVGDDPIADWQGAAKAGLQVFELDRPKNNLSAILPLFDQEP